MPHASAERHKPNGNGLYFWKAADPRRWAHRGGDDHQEKIRKTPWHFLFKKRWKFTDGMSQTGCSLRQRSLSSQESEGTRRVGLVQRIGRLVAS